MTFVLSSVVNEVQVLNSGLNAPNTEVLYVLSSIHCMRRNVFSPGPDTIFLNSFRKILAGTE